MQLYEFIFYCLSGKKSGNKSHSMKIYILHLSVVAIEKGAFWSPSTTVANFTYQPDIGIIFRG